ncbi:MAG TPA: ABC transporter ATP-binding protein [Treponemataceae bacterium]|nr:ABC transporter ATP-binding protein [Treponemataceae bacterium]HPS43439.1 ABC transporter ATP-binding protein [Treponemataceae bacterium]
MKFTGITRAYGETVIYRDFSLELADNTVTAILGPSGCGKTTLLNEIASHSGDIAISFVFQEPRLIPWRTLAQNIELALTGDSRSRRESARFYLERVGLAGRVDDYPESLSGGERQRVSIARAFAVPSTLLLMDEPFQSQDPATKAQLIDLFSELKREARRTIVTVTHDVREACAIADRAILLTGRPVSVALDVPVSKNLESQIACAIGTDRAL